MASSSILKLNSTGRGQRSVRFAPNESTTTTHSNNSNEQNPLLKPVFLQRPSTSSELATRLIPIDVDLHTKKNMEEHSTHYYDIPGLVLRRGQSFTFTIEFNRELDLEKFELYVRLAIGSRSMLSKGTQIRLQVDGKATGNGWSARTVSLPEENKKQNNCVSLQIDSSHNAIVGKYSLLIEIRPINKDVINKQDLTLFLVDTDIYFLFNPWNKDDACSLLSSEQIDEYVMNEHGKIYLGTADQPQVVPWYFGQFERSVLLTALSLLDKVQLPAQSRNDPSMIVRILASRICSNPGTTSGIFPSSSDSQVCVYENSCYTSSLAILNQYYLSNGQPLKGGSGTNWQHAAVFCSLSRAVGIPCRTVTIFNAAYQTDGTQNIAIHWDTKQRPLKQLNTDLTCASRVWNECWMRRYDLPNCEQDWQIVDSTPVQMCDGIRRTGPCSVSLLKSSDFAFRWDSPYLRSAINGHKSHWIVYPDGNMEVLDVEKNLFGRKIITQSLSNDIEPEDITNQYKSKETSSINTEDFEVRSQQDVQIELNLSDDINFGDDIVFKLNANNSSNQLRTVTTALTMCIINSGNNHLVACYNQPIQTLSLIAGKNANLHLKINSEQYLKYGKQDNIIVKYYLHCQVKQTGQTFTREDSIIFKKHDLVTLLFDQNVIHVGEPALLGVKITNTLSRPIHNGRLHVDGFGISEIACVDRSFAPKESSVVYIKLHPSRIGVSRFYITFISNDVFSLTQAIPLEVTCEEIQERNEPLLTKTAQPVNKVHEKNDTAIQPNTLDHEAKPLVTAEQNPSSRSEIEEQDQDETSSTNTSQAQIFTLSADSDIDDDVVGELDDTRKENVQSNVNHATNSLYPNDSTLSLDRDKISIDSLDVSNDHRNMFNNNR